MKAACDLNDVMTFAIEVARRRPIHGDAEKRGEWKPALGRATCARSGQAPRYAAFTCGLFSSSMPGPVMVTRPWSST